MNAKAKHYLALAPAVLVSLFLMIVSGAPKLLVHNQAMTDMAVSVFGSVMNPAHTPVGRLSIWRGATTTRSKSDPEATGFGLPERRFLPIVSQSSVPLGNQEGMR